MKYGKLLTPEDVADKLSVSPLSVRNWLRTGKMKGIKVSNLWRVDERELEMFIEQRTKGEHAK